MNSRATKKPGRASDNKRLTGAIKSTAPRGLLSSSLRGFAVAVLCGIALLFVAALAVYSFADPNRYITPTALSVLFISSLLGGFAAAKINRGSALLCGLITASFFLAALFLLSLFMDTSLSAGYNLALSLGLRGIAIGTSVLGAYIGVSNKKKKTKRR